MTEGLVFRLRDDSPLDHDGLPPAVEPYDDVSVKRVERWIGSVAEQLNATTMAIALVEGALGAEEEAGQILTRMKAEVAEVESSMPRLMKAARKQMRGEQA